MAFDPQTSPFYNPFPHFLHSLYTPFTIFSYNATNGSTTGEKYKAEFISTFCIKINNDISPLVLTKSVFFLNSRQNIFIIIRVLNMNYKIIQ